MIGKPLVIPGQAAPEPQKRPRLEVGHLPESVLDHHSPVWIGNLVLIVIETVMFCILVAAYFYLQNNFELWPPPQVNRQPPNLNPVPDLLAPTVNLVLMLLSIPLMLFTDRSALHKKKRQTELGLLLSMLLIAAIITLRWFEFQAINFRWDDNAYSAIFWTILGLHLIHLMIAQGEMILMTAWIFLKGLDDKHARDVRVAAVYWYWVVGTWVPLYFILFIGPHL